MLDIRGTTIELTCGDSASIAISANDKSGEAYTFEVGDKVKFTIKASECKKDRTELVSKITEVNEPGTYAYITFEPEDTKNLDFREYFYDVQLIKSNGWTETIIEDSIFKVGVEIG